MSDAVLYETRSPAAWSPATSVPVAVTSAASPVTNAVRPSPAELLNPC